MAKMGDVTRSAARQPLACVTITPSAFADTSPVRPDSPVAIGLRFISEAEMATADAEAAKRADREHPGARGSQGWEDAYNSAAMANVVAFGTCDPTDVATDWLVAQADAIPQTLRGEGVELLFREWQAFSAKYDPTRPQATTDDVDAVAVALADGVIYDLPPGTQKYALRLVAELRATLGIADEAAAPGPDEVEGDDDEQDAAAFAP